jgi:tripartite motif-containing protein 71
MKKITTITAAALTALAAACAWGEWVYEGQWGRSGSGDGEFTWTTGVALGPNGIVYVADTRAHRVQYFTLTGSFLGKWGKEGFGNGEFRRPCGLDTATNGYVYVPDFDNLRIQYFTPHGSFVGKWFVGPVVRAVDVAPNGNVYAVNDQGIIQYYTSSGSLLGKWGRRGFGNGEFDLPNDVAIAANGNVYVADWGNERVQYFTAEGSFLGKWGSFGTGRGEFNKPAGIDIGSDGKIFVVEALGVRVQYFTPTGSFLGSFGSYGRGEGEFDFPLSLALAPNQKRIYVCDTSNSRIQYFRWSPPAVVPTSLGRVKALFR